MKAKEFITNEMKQRLDAKCWKGKHKEGTKIKGGVRVNNCVPNESVAEMDKSQKGPAGWNIDDYPLGAKGTTAKPTTPKKVVKDLTKVLNKAFDRTAEPQPSGVYKKNEFDIKESYWTRLQNERNTKLNSLVDELKESIKK